MTAKIALHQSSVWFCNAGFSTGFTRFIAVLACWHRVALQLSLALTDDMAWWDLMENGVSTMDLCDKSGSPVGVLMPLSKGL